MLDWWLPRYAVHASKIKCSSFDLKDNRKACRSFKHFHLQKKKKKEWVHIFYQVHMKISIMSINLFKNYSLRNFINVINELEIPGINKQKENQSHWMRSNHLMKVPLMQWRHEDFLDKQGW